MSSKRGFSKGRLAVAAAVVAAGLTVFAANPADAALIIDVRATGASGTGVVEAGGKSVVGASVGDVINYSVFAQVTGTAGNALLEGFQSAKGTLASGGAGTVQLNLTHALESPFAGNTSAVGTPNNLGGDDDTDIGPSLTPSNTTAGVIHYRSNAMTTGLTDGLTEILIGTGTMTVTAASAGAAPASVNFILASPLGLDQAPLWQEDGTTRNASNGAESVGAAVTVAAVPEPAAAAGLALAAAGLAALGRRRRSL